MTRTKRLATQIWYFHIAFAIFIVILVSTTTFILHSPKSALVGGLSGTTIYAILSYLNYRRSIRAKTKIIADMERIRRQILNVSMPSLRSNQQLDQVQEIDKFNELADELGIPKIVLSKEDML